MKNVVITGSTSGIGLCLAKSFLTRGCCMTISGRDPEKLAIAVDSLSEFSGSVHSACCDVRKTEDIEKLANSAVEKWGSVDIWINNAGVNCPYVCLYDTPAPCADDVIDTNIKGMVYGSLTAAAFMMKQGYGQIWNMEGLGSNNMIQEKTILYGMSKHALTYFTKGLAKELSGTGIMAGRLSPGMMLTGFITKTSEGKRAPVLDNKAFIKVFRTLADRPETVSDYLARRMLANKKNNAHIVWLTNTKAALRFISGRKLDISDSCI